MWVFVRRFLREPNSIGAICPSSRYLARRMMQPVKWDPGVRIVEFGPGTGPFTREILRRLPADGNYLAIERDPKFAEFLQREFPTLRLTCDSVTNLPEIARQKGLLPIDHIISGLPFACLPTDTTRQIIDAVCETLRPGGTFTMFQYVHACRMWPSQLFRKDMKRTFGCTGSRTVVFRNFPPAFVSTWRKPSIASSKINHRSVRRAQASAFDNATADKSNGRPKTVARSILGR